MNKLNLSQYATQSNLTNEINKLNMSQYAPQTDISTLFLKPLFNNTIQSQIDTTNSNIKTNIMPVINYYNTNKNSFDYVLELYNESIPPEIT